MFVPYVNIRDGVGTLFLCCYIFFYYQYFLTPETL